MKRDLYRILKMLRDHKRGIKPDAAWVLENRNRLLMQVRNSMPTVAAAEKNRAYVHTIRDRLVRLVRGPVLAVTTILAVLLGGSLASVSAAERSLPGDSLYPLKLVTEQARLVMTQEKSKRVRLKAEFTKRRVKELKTILTEPVTRKEERAGKAAEILKQDLHTLKQQLSDVKSAGVDRDAAEAAKAIDKDVVEVMNALSEAKKDLSEEVKKMVSDAQAQAADVGIKALEVLVDASNGGEGVMSSEELDASLNAHADATIQMMATTKELTELSTATSDPNGTTSTSALATEAETFLEEAKQLMLENKLEEALGKIREASLKSFLAQRIAEAEWALIVGAASSNANTGASTSTAASGTASSTGNEALAASIPSDTASAPSNPEQAPN